MPSPVQLATDDDADYDDADDGDVADVVAAADDDDDDAQLHLTHCQG